MRTFWNIVVSGMLLGLSTISTKASAQSVIDCTGCLPLESKNAVLAHGPGETYVVNFTSGKMTHWSVYRNDQGTLIAEPMSVDPGLSSWYFGFSDKVFLATASSSVIVIDIGPFLPDHSGFVAKDPWLGGTFDTWNGYTPVMSPANRELLGQALGASLIPPQNQVFYAPTDNFMQSFLSVLFGKSGTSVRFQIHWPDGSSSVYEVTATNPTVAQYKPGESRDADGNPIPDSAILGPSAGSIYPGSYNFSTTSAAQSWAAAAALYGVGVSGSTTLVSMACTWDQEKSTLTCHKG